MIEARAIEAEVQAPASAKKRERSQPIPLPLGHEGLGIEPWLIEDATSWFPFHCLPLCRCGPARYAAEPLPFRLSKILRPIPRRIGSQSIMAEVIQLPVANGFFGRNWKKRLVRHNLSI